MAVYTFKFDAFTLISTASPSPYWDDLVIDVMFSVNKRQVPPGNIVGHLGLLGRGGSLLFSDKKPHGFEAWEFEVELDDDVPQELEVLVSIVNVRGLPEHKVAKLLAKLGVSAVGAVIGGAAPVAEKGAKVFVGVLGAVGGTTASEFLDKLFGEVPDCVGEVFQRDLGFSSDVLKSLPYLPSEPGSYGTWTAPVDSSKPKPGKKCGMPSGVLTYSISRIHPYPMFGTAKPPKQVVTPNTAMNLSQLNGAWVDEISSPHTRVWVELVRSKAAGADLFDVKIREVAETPFGTTVASGEFANVPVTIQPQLAPQSSWHGKLHAYGSRLELAHATQAAGGHLHGQLVQIADAAPEDAVESDDRAAYVVAAKPTLTEVVYDQRVAERQAIETIAAIRERVSVSLGTGITGLATLDQQNVLAMILPNGVVLSFWESHNEGSSNKGPPNGVITSYWRPGNSVATSTYVSLYRWTPIR